MVCIPSNPHIRFACYTDTEQSAGGPGDSISSDEDEIVEDKEARMKTNKVRDIC